MEPVALMMSEKLKYHEGIINSECRTFIMNNQKNRKNIKLKMSVVKSMIKDKNIVDDSIVRGNTIDIEIY